MILLPDNALFLAAVSNGSFNDPLIENFRPERAAEFRATLPSDGDNLLDVTVVQVGDVAAFEKYDAAVHTVRAFASKQGFAYERILLYKCLFNRPWCVLTIRLEALHSFLDRRIPTGGWMIYMDNDIAVMHNATLGGNFNKMIPRTSLDGEPVWFVAQDSAYSVNGGFTIWRKGPQAMAMMRAWEARQKNFETCVGPGDQFSLELAMAEMLNPNVTRQTRACATLSKNPKALRVHDFDALNACWNQYLLAVGLPFNGRSRLGISLLPTWHRINMHDAWKAPPYANGDYLFHGHKANNMASHGLHAKLPNESDIATYPWVPAGFCNQTTSNRSELICQQTKSSSARDSSQDGSVSKGAERNCFASQTWWRTR